MTTAKKAPAKKTATKKAPAKKAPAKDEPQESPEEPKEDTPEVEGGEDSAEISEPKEDTTKRLTGGRVTPHNIDGFVEASSTFSIGRVLVHQGTVLAADDPILEGREHLFRPLQVRVRNYLEG